jgi:hypothetical protein
MKINGTAEIVERNGMFGPGKYLKINPSVSWSWGIKGLQQPKEGEFFVKTVHRGVIDPSLIVIRANMVIDHPTNKAADGDFAQFL